MAPRTPDLGASLGEWNALVRRARIGEKRKYAALMVSSYANADGSGIHCGIATLAVDCEIGYSTARRYMAWMREVGLIELVRKGNQRKGLSDEYRLILGPQLLEHIDLPDPDRYKALKDALREANRSGSAERTVRARTNLRSPRVSADGHDLRSAKVSAEPTDLRSPKVSADADDLRSPRESAETADLRSVSAPSALTQGERPPSLYTFPEDHTFPPDDGDLRTAVTGSRAREAATDPIPDEGGGRSTAVAAEPSPGPAIEETTGPPPAPPAPDRPTGGRRSRCADHPALPAGTRPEDGRPRCALCRAGAPPTPPPENRDATVIPFPTNRTA